MTPQILTETLYGLATQNLPFLPTKSTVLTAVGKQDINQKNFGTDQPFNQLGNQFTIPLKKEGASDANFMLAEIPFV